MKKYLLLVFLLFSQSSYADCYCTCYKGDSIPVCNNALEIPNLICIGVC